MAAVPEPTVLRPLEWSWPVCRALLVPHGFVVRTTSPQDCHTLTYPQTRGPWHPRRVGPPDPRCPESLLPARSHKPPAGAHQPWYLPQAPALVCHVALYVATCTQDLLPSALQHGIMFVQETGGTSRMVLQAFTPAGASSESAAHLVCVLGFLCCWAVTAALGPGQ